MDIIGALARGQEARIARVVCGRSLEFLLVAVSPGRRTPRQETIKRLGGAPRVLQAGAGLARVRAARLAQPFWANGWISRANDWLLSANRSNETAHRARLEAPIMGQASSEAPPRGTGSGGDAGGWA